MQRASEGEFGGGQGDIGVQLWNSGPEVRAVSFTFLSVEEREVTRLREDVYHNCMCFLQHFGSVLCTQGNVLPFWCVVIKVEH